MQLEGETSAELSSQVPPSFSMQATFWYEQHRQLEQETELRWWQTSQMQVGIRALLLEGPHMLKRLSSGGPPG